MYTFVDLDISGLLLVISIVYYHRALRRCFTIQHTKKMCPRYCTVGHFTKLKQNTCKVKGQWHGSECFGYVFNPVFVSEPEGAAEAEAAGRSVSAAAAGLPLGVSGLGHASWPPHPPAGVAEVSAALLQTAGTGVWVRCTHSTIPKLGTMQY